MDPKIELEKMRMDAYQEQENELKSNFSNLSLEHRAQVVLLSRKLVEEEKRSPNIERFWRAFIQLNEEGQALALAYLEAIAANPKYRRK